MSHITLHVQVLNKCTLIVLQKLSAAPVILLHLLVLLYDWYRFNMYNPLRIMVFPGFTSYVYFMKRANVPEVLHIQQVSDVWWVINASNGYGYASVYFKSKPTNFVFFFPCESLFHILDPPQTAGPWIFPLNIILHQPGQPWNMQQFLKSSVSSFNKSKHMSLWRLSSVSWCACKCSTNCPQRSRLNMPF